MVGRRWCFWCQGIGPGGDVPELVSRVEDCNDLSVLIAAIRVTARELNDWRPVQVFEYLEDNPWCESGKALSFRFADMQSYRELPMLATITNVTDEELEFLTGGAK